MNKDTRICLFNINLINYLVGYSQFIFNKLNIIINNIEKKF